MRIIDEKKQREIKQNPTNKTNGNSNGYLHLNQTIPIINLGGNTFIKQGDILKIDDESIVSLNASTGGGLSLSAKLFDQMGLSVLKITDNEWESGDYLAWDIEYKLNFLKLRYKKGDIGLQIDARKNPMELSGNLWFKGQNFCIGPSRILFNGCIKQTQFMGMEFRNTFIFIDTQAGNVQIRGGG